MDPKVGIGVFVFDGAGKFVIGKRKGSLGAGTCIQYPISPYTCNEQANISYWNQSLPFVIKGTWGLPGGHLEFGESFETCAARETLEETGLRIQDVRFLNATNSIMKAENKHYITIFMGGVCDGVDPQVS
jgi:8-oxo-dGTP diphosphatase